MANNKNSKPVSAKKGQNKKTPPQRMTKAQMAEQVQLDEIKRENTARIVSIAIFAVSLLFFFIAVVKGEGVWNILHNAYIGLFGWFASVVFPLLCLAFSGLFTVKKSNKKMTFEAILIVILVFCFSAFIHIAGNTSGTDFIETLKSAYTEAPSTFNGGFFGGLIGWLLLTMGKAPAIIIDVIVILVDILLLSRVTINQFFRTTAKPVKMVVEKAEEQIEKRRNRNVDIFLDEEPPVVLAENNADENAKASKSKKKTKADEEKNDGLGDDETAKIIREINAVTQRNREQRSKVKSLDEIVKDASEEQNAVSADKKEETDERNKKGDENDSAEFSVPKENMEATVNTYKMPPLNLLTPVKQKSSKNMSNELKTNAQLLVETLASFGVTAEITNISVGPTVTRYELKPAAGVRISKITNLSDDIALNLAATNVRIEAPIPGKAAVGIEIPNGARNTVSMREIIGSNEFSSQKSLLSAGLGRDISGQTVFCDIAKMPHLLIAGTTGSGKSVCMNSIIVSVLYRAKPNEVKFLMIDPKKVEFSKYENIPHLLVPVVTDPRKASGALGWAVSEMLKRYQSFSDTGVRDIEGYNRFVAKHDDMEPMPKIVICIDELADLMMAAPKEVEDSICRLAQMARAAGMHLVIATQRPSVDVITGLIKANISSRIALTVSSAIDSRTIIDAGGAEKLLGYGDMLYSPIGASKPMRVQGCYISDEEVESLCDFIKNQGESQYSDEIQKEIESKAAQDKSASKFTDDSEGDESLDPLFEKAVEVVLENGRASTSFLQRKLSVGYSRGSKIMDQLEDKGVIGPQDGAKPREIRINMQQWIQMKANGDGMDFTADNSEQISFDSDDDEVIDNQDIDGDFDE